MLGPSFRDRLKSRSVPQAREKAAGATARWALQTVSYTNLKY